MTDTHPLAAVRDSLMGSGDRMVAAVDGLTLAQLNWSPPAEGGNSIYAIANHALGAQERLILGRIFGQEVEPNPPAGWQVTGENPHALRERWQRIRPRLEATLSRASSAALHSDCEHPRLGKLTGWEMLLLVDRHTAEHVGHVELTRDLAKAAGA
ncbi:MAG TPA: DinB family protein [Dehalococcoidia bacterium]|nr:DinB family protein [Dehalococcoidia bacterium]